MVKIKKEYCLLGSEVLTDSTSACGAEGDGSTPSRLKEDLVSHFCILTAIFIYLTFNQNQKKNVYSKAHKVFLMAHQVANLEEKV